MILSLEKKRSADATVTGIGLHRICGGGELRVKTSQTVQTERAYHVEGTSTLEVGKSTCAICTTYCAVFFNQHMANNETNSPAQGF